MSGRKGLLLKMKLALLLLITILLPTIFLVSGESYQISSYIGSTPTIDGIIDLTEQQSTGKQAEITLQFDEWDKNGDQLPREVKIGSCHTNDSYLYINTVVEFSGILDGNITYFFRKDGYEKPYHAPYDIKQISSKTNSSRDGYREYLDLIHFDTYYNDSVLGGTQDSVGKCFISDSSLTFELLLPLNSGDSLGNDLNVTLADQIELRINLIFWYDGDYMLDHNSYVWSSADTCSIVLLQETAPVTITLPIILFSTGLLIFFLAKRKKSDSNIN